MQRVLSLWLSHLPLDRRIRLSDPRTDGPFSVIAENQNNWRLICANIHARQAGVYEGLSLTDARAICPNILTAPADKIREAALLRALWRWADCLSPRVAIEPPDGLLLDITGCAHLFGGEREMALYARQRLEDLQITARIGVADTKGCARALSRFAKDEITIAPPGKTNEALRPLPIAALDIDHKVAIEMARTGLKTIGQLYDIKSSALARRFGLDLTKALGCSLGHEPSPVTPAAAEPVYAARMTLPEPIGYTSDLEEVLKRLCNSVCGKLEKDKKGAHRFTLTVRCVDTGDQVMSVGFARPCSTVGLIMQQFAHPLDKLKIQFGADWFHLIANHIDQRLPRQMTLGGKTQDTENIGRIISTLGNRIGFDHVRKFERRDSHLPEREFTFVEAVDKNLTPHWRHAPRKRPLRLYSTPERLRPLEPGRPPKRFEWRDQSYVTKSAMGPERLTPAWWTDDDLRTRDYWRIQTDKGVRFWLLSHPGADDPDWFVAGRFP